MYIFNSKVLLNSDTGYEPVTVISRNHKSNETTIWVCDRDSKSKRVKVADLLTVEEFLAIRDANAKKASIELNDSKAVCAQLLELRTPETIKELCGKLCEFLFAGKQLEPKSRSNKLAPYSMLLRGITDLAVGENAYIQIRQNGEEWKRHLYFRYCGLADTDWRDINAKATAKVIDKLQHQEAIDADRFEETISQLLNFSNEASIGAGLIAASGRRPVEIFLQGEFKLDGDGLLFAGQAKKRGEFQAYKIPLVGCTPELWLAKLAKFRSGEICQRAQLNQIRKGLDPGSEVFADSFVKGVLATVDRRGIKVAFGWMSEKSVGASRLRDAYLSVAELRYKPDGVFGLFYQAELAGHEIAKAVSSMPTLNYQQFVAIEGKKECSRPSNYSQELVDSGSDLSQLAALSLQGPAKSQNQPEQSIPLTGPILQSSQTSEISKLRPDNLIALSEEAPAKICPAVANAPDSTESNQAFGGKCSELLTNASPALLDGKTLRERCLADVERLMPASEWLATKSRAQSLFRQRNLERPTAENEFSLWPTPTTYPLGSKPGTSPAGRNRLELKLRSLLPTLRANDGTQGHNTGKTGGVNLTGLLKRDRHLMPGEMANPQIWGWMMGFPLNWCESILMPNGLKALVDLDGGIDRNPLPELASPAEILPADENQSATTEPLASPPKQSPSLSESSILLLDAVAKSEISPITSTEGKTPNDFVSTHAPEQNIEPIIQATGTPVNGRHPNDLYDTPWWLALLIIVYTPLSGVIGECCVGNGPIASTLVMAGLTVWTNDIDSTKSAQHYIDATNVNEWKNLPAANWIVTNPPYSDKSAPIIQAAYNHAKRGIVMLLRQDWDEGCGDRLAFLKAHPPTTKITVPRYCFRKGKNGKWATDDDPVCIYVWDKQAKMQGLTHPIWLGAEDIPLYHRTPDTAPAIELVEAEVKRILEEKEIKEAAENGAAFRSRTDEQVDAIMQDFLAHNASLPHWNKWFISIDLVCKICQIRRERAMNWYHANSHEIAIQNRGLKHTKNRMRVFTWDCTGANK